MSAQAAQIISVVIPDPAFDSTPRPRIVNESQGFRYQASDTIRTLSANNPNSWDIIQGLLYVPDVSDSACSNETLRIIPSNVTRIADLPDTTRLPPLAVAPWTDPECVQAFLSAMRADAVSGAIFFQPNSDNGRPPSVNDPSWSLNDGGQWQGDNQFPIYALPGSTGALILEQLALYSGNMSSAPFSEELMQEYNEHDSVRLVARVDVSGSPGIPSLWVFLIIVLAILLAIVLTTSVIMHLIQRRQRRRLAERVARGEVDLEALGIKRLNVPQPILDKMPTYTYTSNETHSTSSSDTTTADASDDPKNAPPPTAPAPTRDVPYSQPVCPICLDDFIHAETLVRELPCGHIFHPECIDPFLRDNSSLCPMCKKSSLPPGYCPVAVTNIMVRRERLVRRMRARASGEDMLVRQIDAEAGHGMIPYTIRRMRDRVTGRRAASAGLHSSRAGAMGGGAANEGAAEMADINTVNPPANVAATAANANGEVSREQRVSPPVNPEEVPAEVAAQGTSARRAWLRERFASREQRVYEEGAAQAQAVDEGRPKWRRVLGKLFPSL